MEKELKYTISREIEEESGLLIIASFLHSVDRDDYFELLEEKFPDVNWVKDGE